MEIVQFPNPVLRKKAAVVTRFDEGLRRTATEMHALMLKAKGVGLAAPQVGLSIQLLVFNPSGKAADAQTLVNPRLTLSKGDVAGEEGCLSFPGIWGEIERAPSLVVEAQDENGAPVRIEMQDYAARIVQHEFDHLDGILFIDRMTPADRVRVRGALKALEAAWQERSRAVAK
ncbi:MAG: peptide deformylase [Planctomycetes bacterium]|nr:peptide deformylase [Planctomycetota bacterium]